MGPSGMYGLPVTQSSTRRPSKIAVLLITLAVLLVGTIIASIVAGQIANANRAPLERFSVRLTNLTAFVASNDAQLATGPVSKASAETRVISESASSEMAKYLVAKPSKSVIANEADTSSKNRLSDAAKIGNYDAEYQSILKDKLESIEALMSEIYQKTPNSILRTALQKYYSNFNDISKELN